MTELLQRLRCPAKFWKSSPVNYLISVFKETLSPVENDSFVPALADAIAKSQGYDLTPITPGSQGFEKFRAIVRNGRNIYSDSLELMPLEEKDISITRTPAIHAFLDANSYSYLKARKDYLMATEGRAAALGWLQSKMFRSFDLINDNTIRMVTYGLSLRHSAAQDSRVKVYGKIRRIRTNELTRLTQAGETYIYHEARERNLLEAVIGRRHFTVPVKAYLHNTELFNKHGLITDFDTNEKYLAKGGQTPQLIHFGTQLFRSDNDRLDFDIPKAIDDKEYAHAWEAKFKAHSKACSECGLVQFDSSAGLCRSCRGLDGYRRLRQRRGHSSGCPIQCHEIDMVAIGKARVYGVEYELNSPDSGRLSGYEIDKICDSHWVGKSDGSISGGVEFVSIPAPMESHREGYKRIAASNMFDYFNLENAGIHIHVNRASLTELNIYKMIKYVSNPANEQSLDYICARGGRESTGGSYCKRYNYGTVEKPTEGRRTRCGDKYVAINTLHDKSVEFRMFKSTKDESEFMRYIQFVDSLIEYIESYEGDDYAENKNYTEFLTNSKKSVDTWPELIQFLNIKPNNAKAKGAIKKCA